MHTAYIIAPDDTDDDDKREVVNTLCTPGTEKMCVHPKPSTRKMRDVLGAMKRDAMVVAGFRISVGAE